MSQNRCLLMAAMARDSEIAARADGAAQSDGRKNEIGPTVDPHWRRTSCGEPKRRQVSSDK
ncbi:hypothetical protein KCP73_26665 [Salmonella enterica subsp. enterica]|nr:hypothetical protein KCP73_26665 [Salmonella enterica subsp. enterica]